MQGRAALVENAILPLRCDPTLDRSLVAPVHVSVSVRATSFGSHNIIPIAFKPSATASASAKGGESDSNDIGYESISPVPSLRQHTRNRSPRHPSQHSTSRSHQTNSCPDLNLRLPETQRSPHKPTRLPLSPLPLLPLPLLEWQKAKRSPTGYVN